MTGGVTLPDLRTPGAVLDRLCLLRRKIFCYRDANHQRISQAEHDSLAKSWKEVQLPNYQDASGYQQMFDNNGLLWDSENEIRDCERRQQFGPRFLTAVKLIQALGHRRARYREIVTSQVISDYGVDLIEVESGLDSYVDRIAMCEVAAVRDASADLRAAEMWKALWVENGLADVFDSADFSQLRLANDRLWEIKDGLDAGFERSKRGADFELLCRSLYLVNDTRCRLREKIATLHRSAFWDVKEYTIYDPPASWDPIRLAWTS